ncbi:MAG: tetratricopeptide repeat protein [Actinomycetota bacterium]
MTSLPTGTVTLLFTDIEGSTRLLERLGAAYAETLAKHRRVLRDAFERHGGVEVGTEGDAFFVAFPSASEALAAAREGQDALAEGEVRVRMGMHTGEPIVVGTDYIGMDVHRAARIAAAGHGGQILLSEATRALVGDEGLRDLGRHGLKDIGEVHLFQVGEDDFPPLKSLRSGNLPAARAPLLGRERERSALVDMLREGTRLVTVVGPGGFGKTTLSLEVGRDLVEHVEGGVWFVDLASTTDPEQVEPAIGASLGATEDLRVHLAARRALLLLDNFEQVVAAADVVASLLETCPGVACLVTSREALHLRGEHTFPLPPLAEDASVELFRERARMVAPDFDADDELLARVCERLERIPLAIELAAARVRVLDASQLLARLDQRLPVLTGGARDAPERHRALRSTIEWSHDLLDEAERRLFSRLAVFVGGWTLEAAEAVCDADLDVLQTLVEKSLVTSERGRFRMLETIREFAGEQLDASGERDVIQQSHAAYFADLAERAEPQLISPEQHIWLDRINTDFDNLRAAFTWLAAAPDGGGEAVRLAANLFFFWYIRGGRYAEGIEWFERALALSEGERSLARARVVWGAGFLWGIVGNGERAEPRVREALELARELEDASLISRALDCLGILSFFQNDLPLAQATYEECIQYARIADDRWCLADALGTIGSIYPLVGRFDKAKQAGTEGLEISRREDDRQGIRMALFGLALADQRLGDLEPARAEAEEALAICREIGDTFFTSYCLWILAGVEVENGNLEKARAYAHESLALAEMLDVPLLLVCALEASAAVARADGDDERAFVLLTRADQIGRGGMVPFSYVATAVRALGEVTAARGDDAGGREYLERALSIALETGDTWGEERARSALAS